MFLLPIVFVIFGFSNESNVNYLQKKEVILDEKLIPSPEAKLSTALYDVKIAYKSTNYLDCILKLDSIKNRDELEPWILNQYLDCYLKNNENYISSLSKQKLDFLSESLKKQHMHFEYAKLKKKFFSLLEKVYTTKDINSAHIKDLVNLGDEWNLQMPENLRAEWYYLLSLYAKKNNDLNAEFQFLRASFVANPTHKVTNELKKYEKSILPPTPDNLQMPPLFSDEEIKNIAEFRDSVKSQNPKKVVEKSLEFLESHPGSIYVQEVTSKLNSIFTQWYFGSGSGRVFEDNLDRIPLSMVKAFCEKLFVKARYSDAKVYCQKAADLDLGTAKYKLLTARSYFYSNELESAQKFLSKVMLQNGGSEEFTEALMLLGFIQIRSEKYKDALQTFDKYIPVKSLGEFDYRIRYWHVKLLFKLKDERFLSFAKEFIKTYPYSYYGIVLRSQIDGNIKNLLKPESTEKNKINLSFTPSQKKQFDKIELLIQNGWWFEAQAELERLPIFDIKNESRVRAYLWLRSLSLIKAIPNINSATYFEPNQNLSHLKLIFPDWYSDFINKKANDLMLSKFFLSAIIRQESSFDKDAESAAGAIGLMQIMPNTGLESLKKNLGNKKIEEALREFETNIAVGSSYIKRLISKYENNVLFAVAAYNVGPGRLDQWLKSRGNVLKPGSIDGFEDLWIDEIPWDETSFYVKAVIRNYFLYSHIYEGLVELPSPGWKGVLKYSF